jgi:ADP-heptose:LPS heptosyltransferase
MQLMLHGSLGDHAILTGLPEAIFELTGEKTALPNKREDLLWALNPYVDDNAGGLAVTPASNSGKDYGIYYPARVIYDLLGKHVHASKVQPNLYLPRLSPDYVVLNDQAGWPSRRGYKFWNELARALQKMGYTVVYLHNPNFADCCNMVSAPTVFEANYFVDDFRIGTLIPILRHAIAYIGYESGLTHVAAGLKVPHGTFIGAVPPINVVHECNLFHVAACETFCCSDNCEKQCLGKLHDSSQQIALHLRAMELQMAQPVFSMNAEVVAERIRESTNG